MSETPTNTYRLMTLTGFVIDFASPNELATLWSMIRGDGYFQLADKDAKPVQRIPFHAIASLGYHDPNAMLAAIPAASGAKN